MTWWQNAVVYEVYPRSFADADGDGVGDLRGIIGRMPYLASLGIDALWLTPFQRSPQVDQGYDISDYCAVDPLFGTLADIDELLVAAHAYGIRVLIDIVPNHTSTENAQFQAALAAGPGSPPRRLFHFREGRADGAEPPNNWLSVFGGSAWERARPGDAADREWYLHLFSAGQPDWNWDDPAVGDHFEGILRFWFDRGVDGIRVDVAHGLFKAPGLPDSPTVPTVIDGLRSNALTMDQELVHDVYRRWRRIAAEYAPERLLVGEVNLDPIRAARYTRPDELHQSFAFVFVRLGWDPQAWVDAGTLLDAVRADHGSAPTWALENHDVVRTPTRFAGGERGRRRAHAALIALLGLPGAVYVYQGQELAVPEVDVPVDARADPMWHSGGVSRDGARVPLPWTADDADAHGFSAPGAARPWLPVPPDWGSFAVQAQETDAASPLSSFRAAVAARRDLVAAGALVPGAGLRWRRVGDAVLAEGPAVTVVLAMGDRPVRLPGGEVVFSTEPVPRGILPADAAAWVRTR
ncbi:alpha-amylase family glycosyl hydrolase [Microbacterium sp. 179-B 1A2 NHS]|uniref:alpha-amylase family glycosyl hydrolase n=1 Tax=Microbacterium sp. 179-B 1A2 NHS TaxID=3142383 RepID=UPI0039A0A8B4